jgi:hypothetical protein
MEKDIYNRKWITENSVEICSQYEHGVLTLRALHYQLVARGMHNTIRHYKRVVGAMIKARREGLIVYEQFSDHDRETIGRSNWRETILENKIKQGEKQVGLWMTSYRKNRWENQVITPEVWIEKKALQGIFLPICEKNEVALSPCKGYPSLTFLNDAADRFSDMIDQGKTPVILYFGDYDATGEDIPRSIQDNLYQDFGVDVDVRVIALNEEQVIEMKLPPAPTKTTDSRAANWDGLGQVELDAVNPNALRTMCQEAIDSVFDDGLYDELMDQEEQERIEYTIRLKDFVNNL